MEYLKKQLEKRNSILTIEEYKKKGEEDNLASLVDFILEKDGIEDEICSGKKEKIGNINGNDIYIYNISKKYITETNALIYIYIGNKRNNKYKLDFEFRLGKMFTGDYSENSLTRVENVVLKQNIFIQNKFNKRWYLIGELDKQFSKELIKIRELIVREFLNLYFSCKK